MLVNMIIVAKPYVLFNNKGKRCEYFMNDGILQEIDVKIPTWEDYCEEELTEIKETERSWKHGVEVTVILHRETDDTYWRANFRRDNYGDYNSWRDDGDGDVTRVWPVKKVIEITEYVTKDPENVEKND